jgi:Zn-dependent M28 family amino/carboxypeptidase
MRQLACLGLSLALCAQVAPTPRDLARKVESSRLRRTVDRLAGFGTRHTLSDPASETRGIGAARRWLAQEFDALSRITGSRLVPFEDRFTAPAGPRVPKPVEVVNVGAVLMGSDPARNLEAIVVMGHYDSRATDVMDARSDAPGAVDDASGVAMALELAQVMATERPAVSVYFVAVAGEEQGLLGSAHLAQRLKAEGIQVLGALALDTVGNTTGMDGTKEDRTVRFFSEGVPSWETPAQKRVREALGGENDGASRELARYLKRFGEPCSDDLECLVMLRRDRVGRGGDHAAFTKEGFPGMRVTETLEHYDRQHQVPRSEGSRLFGDTSAFFDSGYCARVTRALAGALRSLALAPAPPREVLLGGAVSSQVRLTLKGPLDPRASRLVVYRRRADGVQWQENRPFSVSRTLVLPGASTDNQVFAVATADAEGNESLPVAPTDLE